MDYRHKLKDKNFLIIGRAGMDFYPAPPGTRTQEAAHFMACLGGSSANIGVALVKLGGKACLVTCVSDDAIGRFCLNELDRYGIDRRHVRPVGGEARTSLAVVELRVEDHQSVIYRNGAADFEMTHDDVEAVDYSAFCALIITGTAFAAEPSRSASFHALKLARQAGLMLIFDVDYRPYSWPSAQEAQQIYDRAAALCDIVVGNDVEFGLMAGDHARGLDKAQALAMRKGALSIYKMGEKGAVICAGGRQTHCGIYETTALKPTGAGDAFMGGFLNGLADGLDVETAVSHGAAAAALVVARIGCAPAMPTKDEIETLIKRHETLAV